jgi:hypothetical protein
MDDSTSKNKRLMVAVGGYYPTFSPPGICVEKIIGFLKKTYDVTVISWRHTNEITSDSFDFDGVHIVQVGDWLNRIQAGASGSPFKKRLWRLVRIAYSALRGEGTFYWVRRTMLRELERQFALQPFHAILSVGFPITPHLAGKDFASRHPDVRWMTYSTDTYYKSRYGSRFLWLAKRRSKDERAAYRAADHNFFSREIMNVCQDFLGHEVLAKSSVLDYMLFDPSAPTGFDTGFLKPDRINLLYAGGFIEKARSPEYFLEILARLPPESKIVWHVFSSGCYAEALADFARRHPDRLVCHRPVKVHEIRDVMNACDILVNVSNDMDQFFPSKVFDYLSTGKPILNFTYPKRMKNPLFEKHPHYLDVEMFGDAAADVARVQAFCEANHGRGMTPQEVFSRYPEYTPERNLQELIRQLEC